MLITRGFGICSGDGGSGETVYVSVTNPKIHTNSTGKRIIQSSVMLPGFSSEQNIIQPPNIKSGGVNTNLDISHLTPKITTSLPKF